MKHTYLYICILCFFLIWESPRLIGQKFEHSLGIEGLTLVQNSYLDTITWGQNGQNPPNIVRIPRRVRERYPLIAYHVRFSPFDLKKGGISVSIPMNISFSGSTNRGGGDHMILNLPILAEYSIGYDPFFYKEKTLGLFVGAGGNLFYKTGRYGENSQFVPTASIGLRFFTVRRHVTIRYSHGFSTNARKRMSTQSFSICLRLNRDKAPVGSYY